MAINEPLLTVQEVADLLKCTTQFVTGLIHSGRLKASKLSTGARDYRVKREDLDRFLEENAVKVEGQ